MKGKLIGYSMNEKQFINNAKEEVKYCELWLTLAVPYEADRGKGYYSKSIKTTKKQIEKFCLIDDIKLNKTYEIHYDDNKKIDFFVERKNDE